MSADDSSSQSKSPEPQQPWLIPYENPLKKLKDKEFFRAIPRNPGVYKMLGPEECVLYVGKAKNLRARIASYKQAKPGQVSRKNIRLINLIREIRWEECESEAAALLRENQLIRDLKPPFNTVNKNPESYYFIALRLMGGQVRFRLTVNPKAQGDILYGAFKGRGSIRNGYTALIRLIWASRFEGDRFDFPLRLNGRRPPYLFTVDCPEEWHRSLKQFLNGTSDRLIELLTNRLLENFQIPSFYYRAIQDDLEAIRSLYDICCRRNRDLRHFHKVKGQRIAQERIDDLLVLDLVRRGKIQSA